MEAAFLYLPACDPSADGTADGEAPSRGSGSRRTRHASYLVCLARLLGAAGRGSAGDLRGRVGGCAGVGAPGQR